MTRDMISTLLVLPASGSNGSASHETCWRTLTSCPLIIQRKKTFER